MYGDLDNLISQAVEFIEKYKYWILGFLVCGFIYAIVLIFMKLN
jgi:hypothetical protein